MMKPSGTQGRSVFKQVFGQEKNKDILVDFLNDVLERPDFIYILEATYLDSDVEDDTSNSIVLRCTDQYKRHFLLEIYLIKSPREKRNLSSDVVYNRLLGGEYAQSQKMRFIFMTILEFTLFHGEDEIRTDYTMETKKEKESCIDDIYAIIMELPKFNKEEWELTSKLDCWYYFLKHGLKQRPKTYPKLVRRYPMIRRAYEALNQP